MLSLRAGTVPKVAVLCSVLWSLQLNLLLLSTQSLVDALTCTGVGVSLRQSERHGSHPRGLELISISNSNTCSNSITCSNSNSNLGAPTTKASWALRLSAEEEEESSSFSFSSSLLENNNNNNNDDEPEEEEGNRSFRKSVKRLTKKIVSWSGSDGDNDRDRENASTITTTSTTTATTASAMSGMTAASIVDEAFGPVEDSLRVLEESLREARVSLAEAKLQSYRAIEALEAQAAGTESSEPNERERERERAGDGTPPLFGTTNVDTDGVLNLNSNSNSNSNSNMELQLLDSLTFEDIDYESSEMAPPFLNQDSCLVPGAEPLVRVEKAPDNSRRIFAGIDILASADDVWNVLTNYDQLQNVIPNLVVNDVLDLYEGDALASAGEDTFDQNQLPEEVRCQNLSKTMKGSLLKQVGGAKVAGINFSAKTTVEVREWPTGMPDFAHFLDEMWEGKSRDQRAREYPKIKLKRYRFPRPFAISNLPTRDISMQSIEDDDGEFRLYQGVWRMQPLVGCSPPGQDAMRLTYAVEISPRVYLPVKLIEGRIVRDLCANLEAIREAVSEVEGTKE